MLILLFTTHMGEKLFLNIHLLDNFKRKMESVKMSVLVNDCFVENQLIVSVYRWFVGSRDVAQIDIPTLHDVHTYGGRLLRVFDKHEMRRFIVVICNSEVYTRAYIYIIDEIQYMLLMFNKTWFIDRNNWGALAWVRWSSLCQDFPPIRLLIST
jgi:hypothetical protein